MQGIRQHSAFAQAVGQVVTAEPFRLIDVGGDGSLAPGWGSFGAAFAALVVVHTPDQARSAAAIGGAGAAITDLSVAGPFWADPPFGRLADARARDLRDGGDQAVEPLDAWVRRKAPSAPIAGQPDLDYAAAFNGAPTDLTRAIDDAGFGGADFLRLQGGWGDFELLKRLGAILERPTLQGLAVKVHLHGSHAAGDNSFHNVDRLMRQTGFDLFFLEPLFYSAAALPWGFMDGYPDHTAGGRPLLGTAIYLRDLACPAAAAPLSPPAIAKAAALRALMNLPDQAAELLVLHAERLADLMDVEAGLDSLALQIQENQGASLSYRDYLAAFEAGEAQFYNGYENRARWLDNIQRTAREAPLRIAELEREVSRLVGQLREARAAGAAAPPVRRWFAPKPRPAPFDAEAERERLKGRSLIHRGHHWVFDHFSAFQGAINGRDMIDYVGARTSTEFGVFTTPQATDAFVAPIPPVDEEYFEWTDLLEAVLDSGDTFTMLELGAGFGRWTVRGALAARARGKRVRLGLAEAEPRHQAWLRQHLAANGFASEDYTVFPVAVGGREDEVVFTIAAPADRTVDTWYGQSIVPVDLKAAAPIGEYFGTPVYDADGWKTIIVPQVPLSRILSGYDFVDLADFDLQGAEADAIAEAILPLTAKVRRLHIGTHGHDIEARLRDVLGGHGWVCLQDFACHGTGDTPYGPVAFIDGVQSWINPALWPTRSA